ncbi:helix-hairpin-helix domain-containing protein [Pediococcus inopinatus]|uniref:helix-hairpin-helix domain-containing protein n=1 Tax=Pediococcus inopinatus TaxID=114090 RepID=UPI0007089358|nr:helix-hairpin-helix domain-containing protein [Pediococcus inopinatus]KRN61951.1 comEA protein [Pediococcus inopinatus]
MIEEIWENYKKYIIIGAGVAVIAIGAFILLGKRTSTGQSDAMTMNSSQESSGTQSFSSSASSSEVAPATTNTGSTVASSSQVIYVDVKGAVKHPGIFKVKTSMRVDDAINLAGGMQKTADRKHINLAQRLTDQQVIYVPIRGEIKGAATGTVDTEVVEEFAGSASSGAANSAGEISDSSTSATSAGGAAAGNGTVNLNSATKEQLQTLTGVGEKKADQIIQYREAHGKFKGVEELKEVQGIGDKTFEALKPQLSV